jgi:hypothetical protein
MPAVRVLPINGSVFGFLGLFLCDEPIGQEQTALPV